MPRPRLFRSLDYSSLIISCDNTSDVGTGSSLRTSLPFIPSDLPSVGLTCTSEYLLPFRFYFSKLHQTYPVYLLSSFSHLSFFPPLSLGGAPSDYKSKVSSNPILCHPFRNFFFLLQSIAFRFFRLSPPRGKESSLFVPSFPFLFRRIPTAPCRPRRLYPICASVNSSHYL